LLGVVSVEWIRMPKALSSQVTESRSTQKSQYIPDFQGPCVVTTSYEVARML